MTWGNFIALGALVLAVIGPILGFAVAGARRDGKVDAVLEQMTKMVADHEARLRRGRL